MSVYPLTLGDVYVGLPLKGLTVWVCFLYLTLQIFL